MSLFCPHSTSASMFWKRSDGDGDGDWLWLSSYTCPNGCMGEYGCLALPSSSIGEVITLSSNNGGAGGMADGLRLGDGVGE